MLKKNTAYMLRRDGKLIECDYKHPYIRQCNHGYAPPPSLPQELYERTVDDIIKKSLDSILWLLDNTIEEDTKRDIKDFLSSLVTNVDLDATAKNLILSHIKPKKLGCDIWNILIMAFKINDELNDEFLRVRMSAPYWKGEGDSIYFRVSSTGFNWFPIIWKLVYENKSSISEVNILTDFIVLGEEKFYTHQNKIIKNMLIEDFLALPGNPVVEEYLPVNSMGLSNIKIWRKAHPNTAHELFIEARDNFIGQYFS